MLGSTQLEFFALDGFVEGSQIIGTAQADTLCDEVLRVISDHQNHVRAQKQAVRGRSNQLARFFLSCGGTQA